MICPTLRIFVLAWLLPGFVAPVASHVAVHQAHAHGVVQMQVAIEADRLFVQLRIPLESLLGYERTPANERERQAADQLLARMRASLSLVVPDQSARCVLDKRTAQAPFLEGTSGARSRQSHGELMLEMHWRCGAIERLEKIDLGLVAEFERIASIRGQFSGPKGQRAFRLKRPEQVLVLRP